MGRQTGRPSFRAVRRRKYIARRIMVLILLAGVIVGLVFLTKALFAGKVTPNGGATPTPELSETPTEPTPTPKPAASGNIYSIAEAIRAGNEYAKAQYGVTIDTDLTAENASYFPGTADSVAWLAANGGQEALNRAVRGNVDATFQYLAAMDSADAVRAYARFNCTVRYSAASDEYIVVVLYG